MAEQTFRSPGYFDREISLVRQPVGVSGVPAGVIGTAKQGPAFVPVIVGTFDEFSSFFGDLDPKKAGPYAVNEFLKHGNALTYLRVLGGGANATVDDISNTRLTGQVKNAGFVVTGTTVDGQDPRHKGAVQFLTARHLIGTNEPFGMPLFTDNDSFTAASSTDTVNLVRGVILTASGTRIMVLNGNETVTAYGSNVDDLATISSGKFKLVISQSVGVSVLTASLNPTNDDYISKVLNTNPEKFSTYNHLLYCDFAVDDEVASVDTSAGAVAIVSGSGNSSTTSGNTTMTFRDAFGHFDSRYQSARTTWFISQPFGKTEYNLFYFESLDDGESANTKWKISISDVRGSTDPSSPYGAFTVLVRDYNDTDQSPRILERYPNCNLNPLSENYVAARIGDTKAKFIWDADDESERRVEVSGKYPNKSRSVRIVMNESVDISDVPAKVLPFGFRGIQTLRTNVNDTDAGLVTSSTTRLGVAGTTGLSGSIVPPLPFRFKVTRGSVSTSGYAGQPGSAEEVDGRLYWGVKLERNIVPLNSNTTQKKNNIVAAYAKFVGLEKLDVLATGSISDTFNNNKFTLAKVAFANTAVSQLTGTANAHMKECAYIRDGVPESSNYTVTDGVMSGRITLGTLVNLSSSVEFNRFTTFTKFTNVMYGGFDGVNVLDPDAARLNDKAASSDTGGGAASAYVSPGLVSNVNGTGKDNNTVAAYRTAAKIMTDSVASPVNQVTGQGINLLAIPGIKDSFVTDYAAELVKTYGLALYVMDIVNYDDQSNRLYDNSTAKPDVQKTAAQFDSRGINNNYVAAYFPDVIISDFINKRNVKVAPSVAVLGAISFNDKVGYPWFAPAGFNRAALDFVQSLDVRLKKDDRDVLSDARINPIANFPPQSKVIFGQKTLQQQDSALNRVNVRRLLIAVKRIIMNSAQGLVFDQLTTELRDRFKSQAIPQLTLIQKQAGIQGFDFICDERNNSDEDASANRLNATVVLVPVKSAEHIVLDFVIDDSGVTFTS